MDLNYGVFCNAKEFNEQSRTHYSREVLQLNCVSSTHVVDFVSQLLDFILRQPYEKSGKTRRRRKQGKRGDVKLHLRKRLTRIPLPSVILGNVQ